MWGWVNASHGCSGGHRIQTRVPDPLELEIQALPAAGCGFWESNSAPLEEQDTVKLLSVLCSCPEGLHVGMGS